MNDTIRTRVEDRTAWITLDRPPLNILDIPMMHALDAGLKRVLLGLVTRVVPDGEQRGAVHELLGDLTELRPVVLCLTRRTLWKRRSADFNKRQPEVERIYLLKLMKTAHAQEGVRAFLERRPPVWKGSRPKNLE